MTAYLDESKAELVIFGKTAVHSHVENLIFFDHSSTAQLALLNLRACYQ